MNSVKAKEQARVNDMMDWVALQFGLIISMSFLVWVAWLILAGFVAALGPADLVQSFGLTLLYFCVRVLNQLTGVNRFFWRLVGR